MWGIGGIMAQTEDPDFIQVRIRIKKSLHTGLEKAAEERGASMNAEIVERLERSFQIDRIIGGPIVEDRALLAIAKMVAAAMHDSGRHGAFTATRSAEQTARWHDNAFAYDQAVKAAETILEAFRPEGDASAPALFDQSNRNLAALFENLGAGFANGLLEAVARGASRSSGEIEKIALIRDELGPLRERIKKFAVGPQTTSAEVWGKKTKRPAGKKGAK
jgi:hypothetical protein